jgi:hypothetical protein
VLTCLTLGELSSTSDPSGDWSGATSGAADRYRLNDLLGMHVVFADGRDGDQVTDVRLVSGDRVRGTMSELVMEGFVIGKRRTGTYFGTTGTPMGPWACGQSSEPSIATPATSAGSRSQRSTGTAGCYGSASTS